jgi:hypothetical protein
MLDVEFLMLDENLLQKSNIGIITLKRKKYCVTDARCRIFDHTKGGSDVG